MIKGTYVFPENHRYKDNSEDNFRQKYINLLTVEIRALGLLYEFVMTIGSFLCVPNDLSVVPGHPGASFHAKCSRSYSVRDTLPRKPPSGANI